MRILMATMQLDIGGAETHIVELSKALQRKGVEVFVASNGGAYVAELEESGIKHFKVALHSKSPSVLFKAYKELKKIIFENKIDVVHAHARIPGFLCGLLQKRYGFRFVTTAHWVFDTRFPFRLLTNWGDRSLAVSDDIKKYLSDNYGSKPENIRITINGVDTDKFSDSIDYSDIAKEFSFGENKTRIVYVSRMDIDRSYAAHRLIEAVPKLIEKIPTLEVVIVGGGNDYEPIKAEAEAMNNTLGKRVVITTGSRTDINKFVASGDVFVGVSRAALEAMACKKPAIIAGNEGYIGIFDESRLQISFDTNFCCRGCGETKTEKLTEDLLTVLDPENGELRKALGEYSLETVKKYYSVDTMAEDALKMYASVIKDSLVNEVDLCELEDIEKYMYHGNSDRDIDIMISGYYGFHNSGDDSILSAIVGELKEKAPNLSITVLSKSPEETSRVYGVNSINRFNLWKIWRSLRHTKLLISGGGSLIQDVTSSKSLYYYLTIIKLAKLCGARVMLYANGIGPITKKRNKGLVKKILKSVNYATLRDNSSMQELSTLNVSIGSAVTADPVFAMKNADSDTIAKILNNSKITSKYFVVAVRVWKKNDKEFVKKAASFCEYVYNKYGIMPLFMPMQTSYDTAISREIAKRLSCPFGVLDKTYSPEEMLGIVGGAEFALGMRLHTLIYAAKAAVPTIGLAYDPKVTALMQELGQEYIMNVESIDEQKLCGFADSIMKNRGEICLQLEKISEKSKLLAARNTEIALELLK